ncbi:hypothetical protein HY085_00395 [Candidatus Gottesmanbacteria bacterium]|nr:hypothetical protein [Candidatus Gottesmanbacteria bacterium]
MIYFLKKSIEGKTSGKETIGVIGGVSIRTLVGRTGNLVFVMTADVSKAETGVGLRVVGVAVFCSSAAQTARVAAAPSSPAVIKNRILLSCEFTWALYYRFFNLSRGRFWSRPE